MRVMSYLQDILRTMPRPFPYSAYPWRTKALLAIDWRSIFNLHESVKHNKPHWSRACTASRQVLHWLLWKHHFAPLDTSRVLALRLVLARSNPSLSQPHPVVRTPVSAPSPLPLPSHLHPVPPIHRLPPELLTTIFTHTLPPSPRTPKDRFCHQITRRISSFPSSSASSLSSSSSPSSFPSPSQTPTTPLLLTHICHTWRLLAQHTPSLWSTIHVLCPVRADVAYVAFLLSKTGSRCPLTLCLAHYTTPDPAAAAIARMFVAQARRWRSVSFTLMRCVQPAFAGLRLGAGGPAVPLLESYEVRVDTWAEEDIEAFFDVLHSSRRLERPPLLLGYSQPNSHSDHPTQPKPPRMPQIRLLLLPRLRFLLRLLLRIRIRLLLTHPPLPLLSRNNIPPPPAPPTPPSRHARPVGRRRAPGHACSFGVCA
ncbi:hypothetical protein GALMADRAFT_1033456 [Galerina marginata CBS 339.88]|uniref:Uncharacterized protein n=1 Tax=Galerina marginata (strain CBS 339.88) TaxID=685588 RepID=A0A067SP33_GALM3|nr:hypothetical protein GALMADRAFT_1033456 [Galerina marginata CBS 339.88]